MCDSPCPANLPVSSKGEGELRSEYANLSEVRQGFYLYWLRKVKEEYGVEGSCVRVANEAMDRATRNMEGFNA